MTLLLLWAVAQTGLSEVLADALALALEPLGVRIRVGIYFNLFAWQTLFFAGFYFGFRMARGRHDLGFLAQDQYRVTFFIALGAIALFGIYDRVVGWELLGADYSRAVEARTDRGLMAWIYPIAFVLDLLVVVWLLHAGDQDRLPAVRWAAWALNWVFTRRALVFLGQHSLHVFSFHIVVFYVLATVVPLLQPSPMQREVLLIASVAMLYSAAIGHAWIQRGWPRAQSYPIMTPKKKA